MEAFEGKGQRFDVRITGHAGDDDSIALVDYGKLPSDAKQKMRVLQTMVAHSQYCASGDQTLQAVQRAVREAAAIPDEQAEERLVSTCRTTPQLCFRRF
jgi:hypothetical protein